MNSIHDTEYTLVFIVVAGKCIYNIYRPHCCISVYNNIYQTKPFTLEKKYFELGVVGDGQDTSRHFEDSFRSIRAILPM